MVYAVSMPDLVIRNARLATPEGIIRSELSVEGGIIQEIAITGIPKGEREIDARGRIVMPGVIDVHAHLHDPNFLRRETFRTGSVAAAAGGVTTVMVMPLDTPVLTPPAVKQLVAAGKRASLIDFVVHAGNMTSEAVENVPALVSAGVKSFKAFTGSPYPLRDEAMRDLMAAVKKVAGTLFVHAEDDETLREGLEKVRERKDSLAHHESRPSEAEVKAVKKVLEGAMETGCRLHLAHVTTRGACELIGEAKRRHQMVSAETCPHYLVFTQADAARLGPYLRVNPSLKTKEDQEAIWGALSTGLIDIIATDHAPGTRREKEVGWADIWKAQIGIPGVETLLPLMLSEGVGKGRLTFERMMGALCMRPAQVFGLYPKKGTIRKGSDADLVIVNLKKERILRGDRMHYKCGWTPYEGMKVKGFPILTISRGEVICEDGQVVGKPGRGRFLPL
jgi:allantoinase